MSRQANAAFSIMCHALAKMPDTVERDELLNDFADVARKTVVADVEAIKRAGKEVLSGRRNLGTER